MPHQCLRLGGRAVDNPHRDVEIPWRAIAPFLDGEKRGNNGIVGHNGVVMTALWPGVWSMDDARRRRAIATRL